MKSDQFKRLMTLIVITLSRFRCVSDFFKEKSVKAPILKFVLYVNAFHLPNQDQQKYLSLLKVLKFYPFFDNSIAKLQFLKQKQTLIQHFELDVTNTC